MPSHPLKSGGRSFRFRNGIGGFYWKGMSTRTDLGAQAVDHPRVVLNGRYFGGHIVARPPIQVDVGVVPEREGYGFTDLRWAPSFLTEHHSYKGIRVWWGAVTTTAPTEEIVGGRVGFFDTDWDLDTKEVADCHHSFDFAPPVVRFANFIYLGDYESLRRIYRVEPVITPREAPTDEVVASYPGYLTSSLHLHEGKLYFALTDPNGINNGYIYSWDGFQSVLEYSMSVPGHLGTAMTSFRDQLVVTVRDLGSIIYRNAAGTWTTATVGGFNSSAYANSMAAVKDKLYIANGGDTIYSWDGSSLALAHTITAGSPEKANVCTAFNGRLYYGWASYTGVGGTLGKRAPRLGMFDPDTADATYKWKDEYKTWDEMGWGTPLAICNYRQRILMSIGIEITYGGQFIHRTEVYTHIVENNPYSTWYNMYGDNTYGPMVVTDPNPATIMYMKVM